MLSAEALLEERRGYVVRGLTNRVAQVDAQLAKLGIGVEDAPLEEAVLSPETEQAVVRKGRR